MTEPLSPIVNELRADGRRLDQIRPLRFQNGIAPNAAGSTLIEWGQTRVICAVTVEEIVPRWMKEQNVTGGWMTAEYLDAALFDAAAEAARHYEGED